MASGIKFDGRVIRTPGAYSTVDASGLESIGLTASGIVAVLGTAEGGKPVSAITKPEDVVYINRPSDAREKFRSGQLREVADILFAPASDPDVQGGAAQVIAMKVNPATQSTATLGNTYGNALTLTSSDYGAFTSQVNVAVATGTSKGKLLTITFEDKIESVDDLGGDDIFTIKYTKPTGGWDTMTCTVESGGHVVTDGTRAQAGLDGQISAQPLANSVMSAVSGNAADTTQQIIIYGLDASAAAASETLNLNGTTTVTGTQVFSVILGARIVGTTAGTVTVSDDDPITMLTIASGANGTAGISVCAAMYAASTLSIVADGATTKVMLVIGVSASGSVQMEKFTLTGTTSVSGSATFGEVTFLAVGEVEAARTVTISGEAVRTSGTNQNTISKIADFYNAKGYGSSPKYGFTFTKVTGLLKFDPDDLDVTDGASGAVNCLSPAEPGFHADLWAMIQWIKTNSQYVTATKATGAAGGAVSNTTSPVFLSGGEENLAAPDSNPLAFQDWQDALNLLKQVGCNTIVPLTHDPAVHAALKAHCELMGGIGRDERDGVVGLMNAAGTDVPTKTEIKSQITALNTRHIRAVGQTLSRYNTDGELEEFSPYYLAALVAGMQAGSAIGMPLTFKYTNSVAVRQDASWNPRDDSEELLEAGLLFVENISGQGRRVVRNLTTHLTSNNLAFIEGSVNEVVNYVTKDFRTLMETAVGQPGFAGTVNATKAQALNALGLYRDEGFLVTWRSLSIQLVQDRINISVELAPVLPVNFAPITYHLVTISVAA